MQSNTNIEFPRKFNFLFRYKNVNEIPNNVDKVTLSVTLSKNMSLKNIVKASAKSKHFEMLSISAVTSDAVGVFEAP